MIRNYRVHFVGVDNVKYYDTVQASNNAEAVEIVKSKHRVRHITSVK